MFNESLLTDAPKWARSFVVRNDPDGGAEFLWTDGVTSIYEIDSNERCFILSQHYPVKELLDLTVSGRLSSPQWLLDQILNKTCQYGFTTTVTEARTLEVSISYVFFDLPK